MSKSPDRLTEEYVVSLEHRIAEQRRELQRVNAVDNNGGERKARANRKARLRIARLERYLGIQAEKLHRQYEGLEALKRENARLHGEFFGERALDALRVVALESMESGTEIAELVEKIREEATTRAD